jgi:hypothetical protein
MLHVVKGNEDDAIDIRRKYRLVLVHRNRTGQKLYTWIEGDHYNKNKILRHTSLLM